MESNTLGIFAYLSKVIVEHVWQSQVLCCDLNAHLKNLTLKAWSYQNLNSHLVKALGRCLPTAWHKWLVECQMSFYI